MRNSVAESDWLASIAETERFSIAETERFAALGDSKTLSPLLTSNETSPSSSQDPPATEDNLEDALTHLKDLERLAFAFDPSSMDPYEYFPQEGGWDVAQLADELLATRSVAGVSESISYVLYADGGAEIRWARDGLGLLFERDGFN